MNQSDRDILDKHGERLEAVEISCKDSAKTSEAAYLGVKSIKENHLPHMKDKIDMTFRVVSWGLVVLGMMIAGLGILLVVVIQ